MKKRKAVKHLGKAFKKLREYFKKFLQTQSQEALHAFRVQVKKTKSFLILLESGDRNKKLLNAFKPVKKIFKSTGVIRDAYIHRKQGIENDIETSVFYKQQETLEHQQTEKLLGEQHKHLHQIKKVYHQLKQHIRAISKNEIEQFFSIQINNTQRLLNSHDFSEQLHNGRKQLKHLLYNRKIIPQSILRDMQINFEHVDVMQQLIGDWHDNKLALDFFIKKLDTVNLEAMKRKQEELKNQITAKNKAFC